MMQTIYLIDGSSYIYRAYYAIRNLSSPAGLPTNAILGFTKMLMKIMQEKHPVHLAVVFDAGRVTFRNEIYPEYKANRRAMPDDLRDQILPIKTMVKAFNILCLEQDGFEADDIIGTIARQYEDMGMSVVVVTGDKDLMQIVSNRVTLLDTMKEKEIGPAEVIDRFGVGADRVVDILALAGDSSDNIPGVPGIGEKTAVKLIQEYRNLDELLARADEVKGKNGERVREFADQARLSRTLATIDCHVPISLSVADFAVIPPDNQRLAVLFKEYGFVNLLKDLPGRSTLPSDGYRTILTYQDLTRLLRDLMNHKSFAFDLETTSLNPREAEIVGISFAYQNHDAYYVPVGHRYEGAPVQLSVEIVLDTIRPLLTDPSRMIIGQNLKYDYQVLRHYNITLTGIWCDTMLASYLLSPGRSSHGLDALAAAYLDHKMISYQDVTGAGKDQVSFAQVPVEKAAVYSCEDVDATLALSSLFLPQVEQAGMSLLLFDLEGSLAPVIAEMELAGVLLDLPLLAELSASFGNQLSELESRIQSLAPEPFNINSPKQLGEMLFDRLKLPAGKKTKTKSGWSTNVEELERLAEEHEIASFILQYRSLSKLKSTYTDALQRLVDPRTGRVHTSYNQAVTTTGRLSSSEPNLQNIPIRSEEGRKIRRAFIADKGSLILSADYSQIELRLLAHLSGDSVFCDAFVKGEDIHTRTASEVFDIFPEMVTPEMRRQAKTINFGIIYGQGAFSLAKQLGVSMKTAKEFIDNYFRRHQGARDFLDGCIRKAEECKYVTTFLGRRLPIPDIDSSNVNVRSYAQRNAVNYPIQGSAADLIKLAMLRVTERICKEGLMSRLVMQVHDELVFEVPEKELLKMERLVAYEMENAASLNVPLRVDVNAGKNWSEAH